jgi:hypothetical protein
MRRQTDRRRSLQELQQITPYLPCNFQSTSPLTPPFFFKNNQQVLRKRKGKYFPEYILGIHCKDILCP